MQQKHVIGSAFREDFLNLSLDDIRRLVAHDLDSEATDLGVAKHTVERVSVGRRGSQVLQRGLLVFIIGDD